MCTAVPTKISSRANSAVLAPIIAFCPNSMTGPRILPQSVSSQHSLAKRQAKEFSAAK